jgi:Ca2+-transporting ATPase
MVLLANLAVVVVMGGAALGLYLLPDHAPQVFPANLSRDEMLAHARTMAFTLLAISPLFHAFSCRSEYQSIFRVGLFTNKFLLGAVATSAGVHLITLFVPPLHGIFRTHLMTGTEWAVVLGLAVLPVPLFELWKLVAPKPPVPPRASVVPGGA